jgi:MYXO-CTERM domain-containing protein
MRTRANEGEDEVLGLARSAKPSWHARKQSAVFAAAVASLVTAASPRAEAYCRSTTCSGVCERDFDECKVTGQKLFWPGLCVSFSLQKDSSEFIPFADFERVAEASAAAWSSLECDGGEATISFVRKDDVACHKAEYDPDGTNANIILFQDQRWDYTGPDNTLAKTTVTYDTETGEILDADIELNHAFNEFTTGDTDVQYDLQSILTHELGHFIGLDHTQDLFATMNAGYQLGDTSLRDIEDDDRGGVCDAYPPTREVTCRPEPNGGFSGECAEDPPGEDGCAISRSRDESSPARPDGGVWALLAAGLAAIARRRRA